MSLFFFQLLIFLYSFEKFFLSDLHSWVNSQGVDASAVNSAVGNVGAQLLIQNITDMRNMLSDMGLSIPGGTSDAGSYFNDEVLAAADYGVRFLITSAMEKGTDMILIHQLDFPCTPRLV